MKKVEISKVREFLNSKVDELRVSEGNLGYVDLSYKYLDEDWDGDEDVMLYVYGDRGGVVIGFEYRGREGDEDRYDDEDWLEIRESDGEMCVEYIFEKEGSKVYRRYFDREEFIDKEELVKI